MTDVAVFANIGKTLVSFGCHSEQLYDRNSNWEVKTGASTEKETMPTDLYLYRFFYLHKKKYKQKKT